MTAILPGYEYDIFISYRQNDNKRGSWVTKFVEALRDELDATLKDHVTIYFDENPHDGLHEHHEVDDSLREKLNCLILIPVVSQTFCDPKSFAWEHEFKVFVEQAGSDQFGLKVKLPGGNVANRVLPIRIHDLDKKDVELFEEEIGGAIRPIDFIYKETGVNRPLRSVDNREHNLEATDYRNQVNKVANAIKEILNSLSHGESETRSENFDSDAKAESPYSKPNERHKTISPRGRMTFSFSAKAKRLTTFALSILLLGILFFFIGRSTITIPEANNPVLRYEIPIEDLLSRIGRHALAVSPDGKLLVFIQEEQFYLKHLNDDGPAKPISGTRTERDSHPFFSPDSKWIGFDGEGGIYKIPITGGSSTQIWTGGRLFGMNWIGNQIIFATRDGAAIYSISENGGEAERLYPLNKGDIDTLIWNPQLLPDNKTLLFNQLVNPGESERYYNIRTWELGSTEAPKTIVARGTDVQYLKSGHISYVIDKRLYVAGFDYKTGSLTSPQLIASDEIDSFDRTAQYDFSDNGVLVYYPTLEIVEHNVVWIDKKGSVTKISANAATYFSPRISSDGKDVVVDKINHYEREINTEIINIKMGTNYLFAETAHTPVWGQGDKSIIYIDDYKVFQKPLNLGEPTRMLFEMDSWVYAGGMTNDERYYTFAADTKANRFNPEIGYYDFARDTVVMLDYYNSDSWEFDPMISPDGKWLLYSSRFSGDEELYIVPFPGPGPRYKISSNGSTYGIWAPDMSAVYYIEEGTESDMWEVKISLEPEFSFEKPKSLFRGHYYNSIQGPLYGRFDIHPDGDRFLMLEETEVGVPPGIKVIVNWQQELLK